MKDKQKKRLALLALLLLLLIAAFALYNQQTTAPKSPQTEETKNSEKKLEAPKGGGAVSLSYTKLVEVSLNDQTAKLMFHNPEKSVNELSFEIVYQDEAGDKHILAKSDILAPGDKVTELPLAQTENLIAGNYNAQYELTFYDEKHNEVSAINGVIDGVGITIF